MRKEDTPENIAHGMAQGIFVGFLPIIPLQAVVALLVCTIMKSNKFTGVIGTNIFTSFLTAIPVFYLEHFIGKLVIDVDVNYEKFKSLILDFSMADIASFGWSLWLAITFGGIILGILFYFPVYALTKQSVIKFRNRRKR
ncbi:MAG: DUF2062 domain-containing protein [Candidatus Delongbacteria bacterium]|nr:DUF2062 domain-containing protein [Candidatus Delongbacteria bacterium]MBN2836045.1 DUF2062 domain-containing protein [Candidatus Delongbacteria bacterium]